MPMTAAGIDAQMVIPIFIARYAFAAPKRQAKTQPMTMARTVNSFMFSVAGT